MRARSLAIAAALCLSCPAASFAVLVASTTGNTTAPADDPGFNNVGSSTNNGASVIYLGNRWVLTASHVNNTGAPVVLNGNTYTVTGPIHQLTNNGASGLTPLTDIVMFQINADPGLPALQISPSAPALGDDQVMIGNGRNGEATRTFWAVIQNPGSNNDIWTETIGTHNVEGFKAALGNTKRWGTNDAEFLNLDLNAGAGHVRSFVTRFDDDPGGRPNEAQAMEFDSGGAVFHKAGAQWYLSGMMHAVGTMGNPGGYDNAPANTATFNNHFTAVADLSFYRSQINALMVPEPATGVLALLAAAGLCRRRRKMDPAA